MYYLLNTNVKGVLQFYFVYALFLFALGDFGLKKIMLIISKIVTVIAIAIAVTLIVIAV